LLFQPKKYSLRALFGSISSIGQWHALRTYALSQYDWISSRRTRTSTAFGAPIPWWSYSATSVIDQIVSTAGSVLEIGSGNSTLWWLNRGNSVLAIETSEQWADSIRESAGVDPNLELIIHPLDSVDKLQLLPAERRFDVLHIDHTGDRSDAIRRFLPHLSEHGVLIVDNTDREEYRSSLVDLVDQGYSRLDFFGIGPINAYCWQTTLFFKQETLKTLGRPQSFASVAY